MDIHFTLDALLEQIKATHWAEFIAIIAAIIYLILAARESIWCWFWGIISCSFWAYMTWFHYDLYFETGLQFFYIAISFQGIYAWKYGNKDKKDLPISTFTGLEHLKIIVLGVFLSLLFGQLGAKYTDAAATYVDAFTTVFSVITTYMVIYKKLENWIYWFVIDGVNVYLYGSRGAYFFALLFVVYLFIVVFGWLKWRKMRIN